MVQNQLPYLDLADPEFSTRSTEVLKARDQNWCARTPYGLAVLQHHMAGRVLRDRRFRQGSHAWPDFKDLKGSFAEFWKRSIISLEGPEHKQARQIAMTALNEDFILGLSGRFSEAAENLVENLRGNPQFDFVNGFSEPYAGLAMTAVFGLSNDMAASIAHDASRLGLAMGLEAKTHEPVFNAACDRLTSLATELIARTRHHQDTRSFVARLCKAAEQFPGINDQVLIDLIVIAIFGGVDTTRAQLAFAMELFVRHPGQWSYLRAHPERVSAAVEEIIRCRPTTTWSSREAMEDVRLDGVTIEAGETIHVLVHATATDPAVREQPEFDITRDQKIHFGFGGGAHHCLGQFMARTDMAKALDVLAANWSEIHFAEPPRYLPDSGNTSPVSMIVKPVWTAS